MWKIGIVETLAFMHSNLKISLKLFTVGLLTTQVYRQDLSEFRATVLPREFTRTFKENPETHAIRENIATSNDHYEQLKLTSSQHANYLQDVVGRHTLYSKASDTMTDWLPAAESELQQQIRKSVESLTEPQMVQEQIEKLQVNKFGQRKSI